jgi:hypothetical protein
MQMNKPNSKGLNVSHIGAYKAQIKKLKDKIEELSDIIVRYKIVLNRYNRGWTNGLFWFILGVASVYTFSLFVSLVF